jgi:AcrR family transcriptional regulator
LLLAAAQVLCAERGPYATTAQIAERAGVSEDLIFRYYGSKNGLLKEAVFRPMLELVESMPRVGLRPRAPRQATSASVSRTFVGMLYDLVHGNRTAVMAMVQVVIGGPGLLDDAEVHRLASALFEPGGPGFADHVDTHGPRRSDTDLQSRMIVILIGAAAAFLSGTYADPADAPDRDHVIDELVDFIDHGLKYPD